MKYGIFRNKYQNKIETATFKLEGVEPSTAKNGKIKLMTLFLEDADGKPVYMSNFQSVWDAALLNGFDFEAISIGDDVEVDFVRNDKYLNFIDIRSKSKRDEADEVLATLDALSQEQPF